MPPKLWPIKPMHGGSTTKTKALCPGWATLRKSGRSWPWIFVKVIYRQHKTIPHLSNNTNSLRLFVSIHQGARSRGRSRRVIVKAEHSGHGPNPRYVVTHLPQTDKYLYDKLYCARGDMENRIEDQQMDLFAGRASCHRWWPNPFRQRLSGLVYTLLEG